MKKVYLFLFFLLGAIAVSEAQSSICYSIAGPDTVCQSSIVTYTVTRSPSSADPFAYYSWSTSSEISIIGSSGGSSVTVQFNHFAVGTGSISVQCGSSSSMYTTLTFTPVEILCGGCTPPNAYGGDFYISHGYPFPPDGILCIDGMYNFDMNQTGGTITPTTYDWTYTEVGSSAPPAHWSPNSTGSGAGLSFDHAGTFVIHCKPGISCGSSGIIYGQEETYTVTVQDCTGGGGGKTLSFAAYPNPASNTVTITATPQDSKTTKLKKTAFSYKIYDEIGRLVKSGKSDGSDISVNTSDLQSKIYFVHFTVGNKVFRQQLIIKH